MRKLPTTNPIKKIDAFSKPPPCESYWLCLNGTVILCRNIMEIVNKVKNKGVYRAVRDAMPSHQASNVTVSIEPAGDLRGFFEYLSASIKRVDYLSGATF